MSKNITSTGSVTRYNRLLPGSQDGAFRGVDFSSEASLVNQTRLAFCQNMWRDYESENGGCIETSAGYRLIKKISGDAHGLWEYRYDGVDYVICHMGTGLYIFRHDERDNGIDEFNQISDALADADSQSFTFNGRFYLLDGQNYWVMNGISSISRVSANNPYTPITYSDDDAYEQRNMLTDRFIERWNIVDVSDRLADSNYGVVLSLTAATATATVVAVNSTRQVLYIPGSYTVDGVEYTTVDIASGAFAGNKRLKKVVILGCDTIGANAFNGCTSLQAVVIHNFGSIGSMAFANTPELRYMWLGGNGAISSTAFGNDNSSRFELHLTRADAVDSYSGSRQHLNCSMYIGVEGATLTLQETYPTWTQAKVFGGINASCIGEPAQPMTDEGNWTVALVHPQSWVWMYFDALAEDGTRTGRKYVAITIIGQDGGLFSESSSMTAEAVTVTATAEDTACAADFYIMDPCVEVSKITLQGRITDGKEKAVQVWLNHDTSLIAGTTLSGVNCEVFKDDGAYYTRIRLAADRADLLSDTVLKLYGRAKAGTFSTTAGVANYNDASGGYTGTSTAAISGCNVCTVFDGRPFLTGNPKLPNTVFYCGRRADTGVIDPSYIGVCSFMNDGTGNNRNNALLAAGTTLMVFKERSGTEGSVFYHSPRETGLDFLPKDYPSVEGTSGYDCLGAALNFLDDYLFVTASGVAAVDKEQLNLERTIGHRSSNIDRLLQGMDLTTAKLCEWKGYLVLSCEGEMFLGDSRKMFENSIGGYEYEWFRLTDIGYWEGQYPVHRVMTGGYIHGKPIAEYELVENGAFTGRRLVAGETAREVESYITRLFVAEGEVLSHGVTIKYDPVTMEAVTETDEYAGGRFRPARQVLNLDGVLYFAFDDGGICCFNTDKRGINYCTYGESDHRLFIEAGDAMIEVLQKDSEAIVMSGERVPAYVSQAELGYRYSHDVWIERAADGNIYLLEPPLNPVSRYELDPYWYTYCGRRYRSSMATRFDDCGSPYLAKNTVSDSLVITAKAMRGSWFDLLVRTEREEWKRVERVDASQADFTDLQFDVHSFRSRRELTYKSRERMKKWVKKQYCLQADCFRSPFGIYNLGYGYIIYGKVRV